MQADVPTAPLPVPRNAALVVLNDDQNTDLGGALLDCLQSTGVTCTALRPSELVAEPALLDANLVFSALPWRQLRELVPRLRNTCPGVVLVPCVTGLVRDNDGHHVEPVPYGSVVQMVATLLPHCRAVGAFQLLTAEQLSLAASGLFVSDVPVTGDDREATDLVEGIIDLVAGLDAVYLGGLRTAAAVEGLSAVVREVAEGGHTGGFRMTTSTPPGLRFL